MNATKALFDWLTRNAEAIRWMPEAGQMWDEFRYCARQSERAVDNHPARRYAGICGASVANGTCKRALYRWPDSDHVRCDGHKPGQAPNPYDPGCRHVHTSEERDTWLLGELQFALLPLQFWTENLPAVLTGLDLDWPSRKTYWQWIKTHRLTPKTTVDGVDYFSGGDVLALVTREQPRIRGNIAGHARRTA